LDQGKSTEEIKLLLKRKYGLNSEKANLLLDICQRQRPFVPLPGKGNSIGVYIGIPFCPSRCHYCSFPSYKIKEYEKQVKPFLTCLLQEIALIGQFISEKGWLTETIYLGGGTPTTLNTEDLEVLLSEIRRSFDFRNLLEFTVEAGRPETVDEVKLDCMFRYGVDRISINPQTMQDETLKRIGREHSSEQIVEAVNLVRKHKIPVLNMDLIIGLPGEDSKEVEDSLETVLRLKPENITVHSLALKKSTYWQEQGQSPYLVQDDLARKMVNLSQEKLQQTGYLPYYLYRQKNILGGLENIGYCLPNKECLYNIQMMEDRNTIVGLGVGAMTKLVNPITFRIKRKPNPKDLFIYRQRLDLLVKEKIKFLSAE
jgi:oxygen-independent coproporphyrinogen-3 oxidase